MTEHEPFSIHLNEPERGQQRWVGLPTIISATTGGTIGYALFGAEANAAMVFMIAWGASFGFSIESINSLLSRGN